MLSHPQGKQVFMSCLRTHRSFELPTQIQQKTIALTLLVAMVASWPYFRPGVPVLPSQQVPRVSAGEHPRLREGNVDFSDASNQSPKQRAKYPEQLAYLRLKRHSLRPFAPFEGRKRGRCRLGWIRRIFERKHMPQPKQV